MSRLVGARLRLLELKSFSIKKHVSKNNTNNNDDDDVMVMITITMT